MTKRLLRLLGPLLFLAILSRLNLAQMTETIRAVELPFVMAALLLYPCLVLMKAWRWRMLLGLQEVSYGLTDAFLVYNSSLGAGYITPGRLGEFVKALYLQRDEGVPLGQALSGVLVDRLFDLYLLLMTAGLGVVAFSLPGQLSAPALAALLAAGLAPLMVIIPSARRKVIAVLMRAAHVIGAGRHDTEVEWTTRCFQRGMEQLLDVRLLAPLLVTILAYALFYLQCYLTALALQLPLSYPYAAYCISLASLLALLPVSISGLGVRDAAFIALLRPLGLGAEMAVSYSLLILLVFNVFGAAMGAIAWVAKPLK